MATGDIQIEGQNIDISKEASLVAGMVFEQVPVGQSTEAVSTQHLLSEASAQNERHVREIQRLPTFQAEGSQLNLTASDNLSAQGQLVAQQAVRASGAQVDLSQSQVQSYHLIANARDNLTANAARLTLVK